MFDIGRDYKLLPAGILYIHGAHCTHASLQRALQVLCSVVKACRPEQYLFKPYRPRQLLSLCRAANSRAVSPCPVENPCPALPWSLAKAEPTITASAPDTNALQMSAAGTHAAVGYYRNVFPGPLKEKNPSPPRSLWSPSPEAPPYAEDPARSARRARANTHKYPAQPVSISSKAAWYETTLPIYNGYFHIGAEFLKIERFVFR